MYQTVELTCPGCGAPVSIAQKECKFCHSPITISTFQSVYDMPAPEVNKYAGAYRKALADHPDDMQLNKSAAFCYLKLKLYDKAQPAFEKAIEDNFDDADLYLYAAVCLLKGKRPFLTPRKTVDQALEYLNAALMIEEKGIYCYLAAYLKYDHYELKRLCIQPDSQWELARAASYGVSDADRQRLFALLGQSKPAGF